MNDDAGKTVSAAVMLALVWTIAGCTSYRGTSVQTKSIKQESAETKKSPEEIVRECQKNLINLDAAVDRHKVVRYGRYPSSLEELAPDFINFVPRCPLNGARYRLKPSKDEPRAVVCPNGHRV